MIYLRAVTEVKPYGLCKGIMRACKAACCVIYNTDTEQAVWKKNPVSLEVECPDQRIQLHMMN